MIILFDGTVQVVTQHGFSATLANMLDGGLDHFCEVDIESIREKDRKFVKPGAIFYWYIDEENGYDKVVFSRKKWTEDDVQKIKEKAKEYAEKFGVADGTRI